MANNKQQNTEPERKYVGIVRDAYISINVDRQYALITCFDGDGAVIDLIDAIDNDPPCDVVTQDGKTLVELSRFARVELPDGTRWGGDDPEVSGSGMANIKLRHAEYDWTYKRKTGHTSKLEIIGVRFADFERYDGDALVGL